MKKGLTCFLIMVVITILLISSVFADTTYDRYDDYPGGGMNLYQTPMCMLGVIVNTPPSAGSGSNPFSGYDCLNQLTWSTPVSGTNVTLSSYNNNNTQKYYRFTAHPTSSSYTSCGYAPVNAPELSINRRRILPSYVNMITTVGNTMNDFNIHPGSCHYAQQGVSGHMLVALPHEVGAYQCDWTFICRESLTSTYLQWQDNRNPTVNVSDFGLPIWYFWCGGSAITYDTCGLAIQY